MATIRGKFGIIMVAMILVMCIVAFASANDNDDCRRAAGVVQHPATEAREGCTGRLRLLRRMLDRLHPRDTVYDFV
jgi:hypothetical protein